MLTIQVKDSDSGETKDMDITELTEHVIAAMAVSSPEVTSVSPTEGEPGSEVTVTGSGFNGLSVASVGGTKAEEHVVSPHVMTFKVPKDAKSGPLHVHNGARKSRTSMHFTVKPSTAEVPTVTDEVKAEETTEEKKAEEAA